MGMTGQEWLEQFAAALDVPAPTDPETDAVLGLAGVAAHASERTAAPISAWLAGRAGIGLDVALEAARRLADAAP
jgi:hypothetical protein